MKSLKFYDLALWLSDNKKCEEGFRTTISRAYYSAFHAAQSLLSEMGVTLGNGDKHRLIPDLLDESKDSVIRGAAEKLRQLRRHRNNADYEMANLDPEKENFARLRCDEAKQIMKTLNDCLSTKPNPAGQFQNAKNAISAAAKGPYYQKR